jgi:hypothetical protein
MAGNEVGAAADAGVGADDAALDDGGIAHAGSGSPLLMPMRAWQGADVGESSVLSSVKAS